MNISSYPSIYAIGHAALTSLLEGPVVVQEKIDGSQFSFGMFDGELRCRSKGAPLHIEAPERMFTAAIDSVKSIAHLLVDGWTYRAEYLAKPRHNALAYDRIPAGHLILFDINTGLESYVTARELQDYAVHLGLEAVPILHHGYLDDMNVLRELLDTTSVLGGQKIEGVVIKNYAQFGRDKKVLMGKFVSEAFKEVHAANWKESNPHHGDIIQMLVGKYRTPARWAKAVQHLREAGTLEASPRDIGPLIREVNTDIEKECAEEIAKALYDWAIPSVRRGATAGLPEWWKEELMKAQFDDKVGDATA